MIFSPTAYQFNTPIAAKATLAKVLLSGPRYIGGVTPVKSFCRQTALEAEVTAADASMKRKFQ